MDEIQIAAKNFHKLNRYASEKQAEEAADIEFSERSDQREFVACWRRLHDEAARIRQSEFQSDVDRIWPESKGY